MIDKISKVADKQSAWVIVTLLFGPQIFGWLVDKSETTSNILSPPSNPVIGGVVLVVLTIALWKLVSFQLRSMIRTGLGSNER